MKKWLPWLASLLLLFPAHILMMLLVWSFVSMTNQLDLGYGISCLLCGTGAALPILLRIRSSREKKAAWRWGMSLLIVLAFSGILFVSALSF